MFGFGSNGVLTKVGKGPYRRFVQLGCRVWWTRWHYKFGICPIVQDQFEYGGDDQCVANPSTLSFLEPDAASLIHIVQLNANPALFLPGSLAQNDLVEMRSKPTEMP